jgi:hypothetical protein
MRMGMFIRENFIKIVVMGKVCIFHSTTVVFQELFKRCISGCLGEMKFINGDIYSGDWKANKMDGQGCFRDKYGAEKSGIWSNNKLVKGSEMV